MWYNYVAIIRQLNFWKPTNFLRTHHSMLWQSLVITADDHKQSLFPLIFYLILFLSMRCTYCSPKQGNRIRKSWNSGWNARSSKWRGGREPDLLLDPGSIPWPGNNWVIPGFDCNSQIFFLYISTPEAYCLRVILVEF